MKNSKDLLLSIKESKGLTTAALAREFGVSRNMMTKYLSGAAEPKYSAMMDMLDRIGYRVFIVEKDLIEL